MSFATDYPRLNDALALLAADVGYIQREDPNIGDHISPGKLRRYNQILTTLTDEEFESFVIGEDIEQEQVAGAHGNSSDMSELSEFLEEVFDGELTDCFYLSSEEQRSLFSDRMAAARQDLNN